METLGLPVTFMIYAVGCIFGAAFVIVFLVEMTGKSIDYTLADIDEKWNLGLCAKSIWLATQNLVILSINKYSRNK